MKFAHESYDRSGAVKPGTIEAESREHAEFQLRERGLYPTSIEPVLSASQGGLEMGHGRRLRFLSMLSRQLTVLIATGTPLVESLHSVERQTKDERARSVLRDVRRRVEEGATFAEAMEAHPKVFDTVVRSLVHAGEMSGQLESMLSRVASLTKQQHQIRSSVIGAMVYPSLLVTIAVSVLVLMLVFVLPRFSGLFESLDMPLPATTDILMTLGVFMRGYWWLILTVLGGLIGAGLWFSGTPRGRRSRDDLLVSVPWIRGVVRGFETARIARLLGVLLESKVPLLETLELTRTSMANHHYAGLLEHALESVTSGRPVSNAFEDSPLVTPSVYEAVRSGEQSGRMGAVLLSIADFLDDDNQTLVRSLSSVLEPLILLVLGLVVGFVALSLFLPLFDLTSMTGPAGGAA